MIISTNNTSSGFWYVFWSFLITLIRAFGAHLLVLPFLLSKVINDVNVAEVESSLRSRKTATQEEEKEEEEDPDTISITTQIHFIQHQFYSALIWNFFISSTFISLFMLSVDVFISSGSSS